MKKFALGLTCGILLSVSSVAYASDTIQAFLFPAKFNINGQGKLLPPDYVVLNYNGHAYVPIRFIAESMGTNISYEEKTQTIVVNEKQQQQSEVVSGWEGDLFHNGKQTKLVLNAENRQGAPVAWRLLADGVEKFSLSQPSEGMYGVAAEMIVEDIDGDQKPEVLIYRSNTGSAGAKGLTIYSPSRNWSSIFSVENPFHVSSMESEDRYMAHYTGDLKVRFEDKRTGLTAMIPINLNNYGTMDEEEKTRLFQAIQTWVDPIMEYKLEDGNGDGIQEITAIQRIIGVSHADTLALLKSTYELSEGVYKQTMQSLYEPEGDLLEEVKMSNH